jgi:hypothetical protein
VYELTTGQPLPDGMLACHKCDNPACCRPDHIFVGTHAANMMDMRLKQRGNGAKGEANGHAKLTTRKVRRMRRLFVEGWTITQLASRYRICYNAALNAITGRTWKHIPLTPEQREAVGRLVRLTQPGEAHRNSKLTAEKVRAIRWLATEGIPLRKLARQFGVSATNIRLIVKRQTWAHVEDLPVPTDLALPAAVT